MAPCSPSQTSPFSTFRVAYLASHVTFKAEVFGTAINKGHRQIHQSLKAVSCHGLSLEKLNDTCHLLGLIEVEALLLKGASHRHPNKYSRSISLDIIELQDARYL